MSRPRGKSLVCCGGYTGPARESWGWRTGCRGLGELWVAPGGFLQRLGHFPCLFPHFPAPCCPLVPWAPLGFKAEVADGHSALLLSTGSSRDLCGSWTTWGRGAGFHFAGEEAEAGAPWLGRGCAVSESQDSSPGTPVQSCHRPPTTLDWVSCPGGLASSPKPLPWTQHPPPGEEREKATPSSSPAGAHGRPGQDSS